jgi:glycosyltransferase involved in cell wall biosynthesis
MEDVVTGNHPLPVDIPADVPVVINPRGFRPGSVRNDTFFQAASLVLREKPETLFLCAGMAGQPEALQWLERLGIEQSFRLLPFMPQEDLWRLFRRASVTVSISQHDGTPNSLLEAMALGCFPVVGDIESTREWITDGENGCLVYPGDVEGAARAILSGLNDMTLRDKARAINAKIIQQRADRQGLIKSIRDFYISLKS